MNKLFLTLLTFLCSVSISNAIVYVGPFTPGVPTLNGSLAILSPGSQYAMLGVYYFTNPITDPPVVSPSGSVIKDSSVQWVDTSMAPPSLSESAIKASITPSEIAAIANNDPTKYPKVSALGQRMDAILVGDLIEDLNLKSVGETFCDMGQCYKVYGTGATAPTRLNTFNSCGISKSSNMLYVANQGYLQVTTITSSVLSAPPATCSQNVGFTDRYYVTKVSEPGTRPVTADKLPELLAPPATSPDGVVASTYQDEIEKMFHDPNYVPKFSDATGLPFSPPPATSVMSPDAVVENNRLAALGSPSVTTTGAPTTVNNPDGTSTTTTKTTTSGGVGGSSTTTVTVVNAGPNASGPVVSQKEEVVNEGASPAFGPDNVYDPLVIAPDTKSITELMTSFVASAPLVTMVKSFVINTTSSSGVVPIGTIYGKELTFDFTRWQPLLVGCGAVLLVIMHGFSILIVIRGW